MTKVTTRLRTDRPNCLEQYKIFHVVSHKGKKKEISTPFFVKREEFDN